MANFYLRLKILLKINEAKIYETFFSKNYYCYFYIRGLAEYSGYCMAASSFFALSFTFVDGGHIRITLFLEKTTGLKKRFLELWSLIVRLASC